MNKRKPAEDESDTAQFVRPPREIARQRREALERGTQTAIRDVAVELTDQLIAGGGPSHRLATEIRTLAEADPTVVTAVLPKLDKHVVRGLDDTGQRQYYPTATELAIELAKIAPGAVAEIEDLLRVVDNHSLEEENLNRLLSILGREQSAFLAEQLETFLDAEAIDGHCQRIRCWAYGRGFQTVPEAFETAVETRHETIKTTAAEDRGAATAQLGRLGLVAPELVSPTVPTLATLATDGESPHQLTAIEALGRIGGTVITLNPLGVPAAKPTAILDALETALDTGDSAATKAAATALFHVARDDEELATQVVTHLVAHLERQPSNESVTEALLAQLARFADHTEFPVEMKSDVLVVLASVGNQYIRRRALRLLGHTLTTESPAEIKTLIAGVEASDSQVRAAAVEGIETALRRGVSAKPLQSALIGMTTDEEGEVREDAVEALTVLEPSTEVCWALERALRNGEHETAVAETVSALETESVVAAIVTAFVDAVNDTPKPTGGETERSRQKHDKDSLRVVRALETLAEEFPESLGPHVETLVTMLCDETEPTPHTTPKVLVHLAEEHPVYLEPYVGQLRDRLIDGHYSEEAGPLLKILALAGADRTALATIAGSYQASDLGPGLPALADRAPLLALRQLPGLEADIVTADDHHLISNWSHSFRHLALSDSRVAVPALGLVEATLTADDDWVRWDGANATAAIGRRHPQRLDRFRDLLTDALDDWNSNVVERSLRSLGHVGTLDQRPLLEQFKKHSTEPVREAAATALGELSAPPHSPQMAADEADSESVTQVVWAHLLGTDGEGEDRKTLPLSENDSPERRTQALASLLMATLHPTDSIRSEATDTLISMAPDDITLESKLGAVAAPVAHMDADEPMRRALAVYTVGEQADRLDSEATAAVLDRLVVRLDDEEQVVQQWAIRSIERLGMRQPAVIASQIDQLVDCLDANNPVTRATTCIAFTRLGDTAPNLVTPAVESLSHCLTSPRPPVAMNAATALTYAPPSDLAAVPNILDRIVSLFEMNYPRARRDAGILVFLVACETPAKLTPHLESLFENSTPAIEQAIAALATDAPEAVAKYEDELADLSNKPATRQALAAIASGQYLNNLRATLDSVPEQLLTELGTFVDYVMAVEDETERERAIEIAAYAADSTPEIEQQLYDRLAETLAAPSPTTRKHAAAAIELAAQTLPNRDVTGVYSDEFVPALLTRAADDEWTVRSQTLQALDAVLNAEPAVLDGTAEAVVDTLFERLRDEHSWTRRHAASALGTVPAGVRAKQKVWARLLKTIDSDDSLLIRGVTRALATTATDEQLDETLEVLTAQLRTDEAWIRQEALDGITLVIEAQLEKSTTDRESILTAVASPVRETVRDAVTDETPAVRAAACRCLGVIGTEEDENRLRERTSDVEHSVREAAQAALETDPESQ